MATLNDGISSDEHSVLKTLCWLFRQLEPGASQTFASSPNFAAEITSEEFCHHVSARSYTFEDGESVFDVFPTNGKVMIVTAGSFLGLGQSKPLGNTSQVVTPFGVIIHPGEFMGEFGLHFLSDSIMKLSAIGKCRAIVFDPDTLRNLSAIYPQISYGLFRSTVEKIRQYRFHQSRKAGLKSEASLVLTLFDLCNRLADYQSPGDRHLVADGAIVWKLDARVSSDEVLAAFIERRSETVRSMIGNLNGVRRERNHPLILKPLALAPQSVLDKLEADARVFNASRALTPEGFLTMPMSEKSRRDCFDQVLSHLRKHTLNWMQEHALEISRRSKNEEYDAWRQKIGLKRQN